VAGLLEEYGIIPVHKSYLVNVMHIQGYTSGEKYNLTLTNAVEIKVTIPKKTILQYLLDG